MRTRRPESARREEDRPRSHQASPPALGDAPRPHVDRIASAWLIKRFIDPDATFISRFLPSFRRTRSRSMHRTWS